MLKIDMSEVNCPAKRCKGVMVRQPGSRLSEGLGQIETKCDRCGQRYVILPKKGKAQ